MDFDNSIRQLDAAMARGASVDELTAFCRAQIEAATNANSEDAQVYLSGRLADIYRQSGDIDEATRIFEGIWQSQLAPAISGLPYVKLLLKSSQIASAASVAAEMAERLERDRAVLPEQLVQIVCEAMLVAESMVRLKQHRFDDAWFEAEADRLLRGAATLGDRDFLHMLIDADHRRAALVYLQLCTESSS